jgi:DNA-binding NarL/FixJ family response regulator
MKTITVLLCDDHTAVRKGLRLLLEATEDIEVVGEVENGRLAVEETKRHSPDVVILDLSMPILNGIEATRQITRNSTPAKMLILSAFSDDQHIQEAIEAGAVGYVTKGDSADILLQAIREIANGNTFFSRSVGGRLLERCRETYLNSCPLKTRVSILTGREREILRLIAQGFASNQIAGSLSLSIKAIEKHREHLMEKLEIRGIPRLAYYAVSNGFMASNLGLLPVNQGNYVR